MPFFKYLILLLLAQPIAAQSDMGSQKSVIEQTPDDQINAVYEKFSEAYRKQNVYFVSNLYQENAFYIVGESPMIRGREDITKNFKKFFKSIKNRNMEMTIEFKIVDRIIDKTLAHDIGYYVISYYKKGYLDKQSSGKFSTVLSLDKDDQWRFVSDTYHIAHMNEYLEAKGILIKYDSTK